MRRERKLVSPYHLSICVQRRRMHGELQARYDAVFRQHASNVRRERKLVWEHRLPIRLFRRYVFRILSRLLAVLKETTQAEAVSRASYPYARVATELRARLPEGPLAET